MSYRELPPLYFPQKSQDFRSVVVREQDRDRALAVLTKEPDNLKALTDMALISFEEGDSGFVKGLEFGKGPGFGSLGFTPLLLRGNHVRGQRSSRLRHPGI